MSLYKLTFKSYNMEAGELGLITSLSSVAFLEKISGMLLLQNVNILILSFVVSLLVYYKIFEYLRKSKEGRIMILIVASLLSVMSATWIVMLFLTLNLWLIVSIGLFLFNMYACLRYSLLR